MLTAGEMITLKSKIKTEMARRKYNGSLAEFSGTAYDFIETPANGKPIKAEHGQKTINLLLKIKPITGLSDVVVGKPLPNALNSSLITYVDNLAKEAVTGSSSSCNALCTGLCTSQCSGLCKGTCSGGCGGNCEGGCSGSCTGDCSGGCGGCTATCRDRCDTQCDYTCYGSCGDTCSRDACSSSCDIGCAVFNNA